MKLKFWEKKKSKIEELYERHIALQLRQAKFEKNYYDVAWRLEKKRNNGKEYCV